MSQQIKTLIVEFAPRGKESKTQQLRKYFTNLIKDKADITILDLAKESPKLFDTKSINIYYKRNYKKQKLSQAETNTLKEFDRLRDQLLATDVLVLSSPLYNFGFPAPIKAWIDAVMQKGYVYNTDTNGHIPLLSDLKVCTIYTSGIMFDQIHENESWNGLTSVGVNLFEYMGAKEVRVVSVEGVDMLKQENIDYRTKEVAHTKLNTIAKKWYGADHNLKCYSN